MPDFSDLKNFKLVIEYDGTSYHGWQRQKKERTIQETIENAIAVMTRQKASLIGSGRTDAGVHAFGQTANFRCQTRLSSDIFFKGLNSLLPDDIVIRSCNQVETDFHARFDAKSKRYRYRIENSPIPHAIGRHYTWHIRNPLDMDRMNRAAKKLVGTLDFKAFEGSGSPRSSTVRTVFQTRFSEEKDDVIAFDISADGFLKFMVRNLVGTLVDIGLGQREPEDLEKILNSRDRGQAGMTAPPRGLFLMEVVY